MGDGRRAAGNSIIAETGGCFPPAELRFFENPTNHICFRWMNEPNRPFVPRNGRRLPERNLEICQARPIPAIRVGEPPRPHQ